MVWCIIVAVMDNVLKPCCSDVGSRFHPRGLLGRDGGFVAMGIIGLFVSPIVLSVGLNCSFLAGRGLESIPATFAPSNPFRRSARL